MLQTHFQVAFKYILNDFLSGTTVQNISEMEARVENLLRTIFEKNCLAMLVYNIYIVIRV